MLRELNIGNNIQACTFSPDRKTVLATCHEIIAKLWDLETGVVINEFIGHTGIISDCGLSIDRGTVLTISTDSTVKIWDLSTGALLKSIEIHSPKINLTPCKYSPDGKTFITTHDRDEENQNTKRTTGATLWDSNTGEPIHTFKTKGTASSVAFLNDGSYVFTTSLSDNIGTIWNTKTKEQQITFNPLYEKITNCMFSPKGNIIMTIDDRQSLMLWNTSSGELVQRHVYNKTKNSYGRVKLSPDGQLILTTNSEHSENPETSNHHASLWNIHTGKKNLSFSGHHGYISDTTFSPDGKYILTTSSDHTAKLFDSKSGEELKMYIGHSSLVLTGAFSPDSQQVLTCSADNTAKTWATHTGELIHTFNGHTAAIYSCCFSPDGKTALTASSDGTIRQWDTKTGFQIKLLFSYMDVQIAFQVSFSPKGHTVIFPEKNNAIILDVQTGHILHRLCHASLVNSCAFSFDGVYIVTGSSDSTTKFWDARTGTLLRTFFTSQVDNIALSWPASSQDFIKNSCVLRKLDKKQDIDWKKPLNWVIQDKYFEEQQPIRTWPLIKLIARYGDQTSRQLLSASAQSTTETKQST